MKTIEQLTKENDALKSIIKSTINLLEYHAEKCSMSACESIRVESHITLIETLLSFNDIDISK